MNAVKEEEQDKSAGRQSAGSTENQNEDAPKQAKSNLSRCAACYNHKASVRARWGGDGESSSSAEDSGPEVDSESEAEFSSSSSCSEEDVSETLEDPSPELRDAAEAESGGKDGRKQEEASRRTPVITSSSPVPHLTPLSLLPRPHTVVSTLHLQVLSQNHRDDAIHIVQQQLSGREEEQTGGGNGAEGVNSVTPPQLLQWQQAGSQWQQQLSYQQQPQHCCPLSVQGQRLPPPMHTRPVPHPPTPHTPLQAHGPTNTYLHAPTPPPYWYWHYMHLPYPYY